MTPEETGELEEPTLLPYPGEIGADRPAAALHPVAQDAPLLLEEPLSLRGIPQRGEELCRGGAQPEHKTERKPDAQPEPSTG